MILFMINKKLKRSALFKMLITGFVVSISACKMEELVPRVAETVKDINGTWAVASATLNGTELMALPNSMTHLNDFSITFSDGKYTLQNPVPFIVSANGNYSFNDPQYPLDITFNATGAPSPAKSTFVFPVVQGQRMISLTFSPGCSRNVYKYTLKRSN